MVFRGQGQGVVAVRGGPRPPPDALGIDIEVGIEIPMGLVRTDVTVHSFAIHNFLAYAHIRKLLMAAHRIIVLSMS